MAQLDSNNRLHDKKTGQYADMPVGVFGVPKNALATTPLFVEPTGNHNRDAQPTTIRETYSQYKNLEKSKPQEAQRKHGVPPAPNVEVSSLVETTASGIPVVDDNKDALFAEINALEGVLNYTTFSSEGVAVRDRWGRLHSSTRPAVVNADGSIEWWKKGRRFIPKAKDLRLETLWEARHWVKKR